MAGAFPVARDLRTFSFRGDRAADLHSAKDQKTEQGEKRPSSQAQIEISQINRPERPNKASPVLLWITGAITRL